MLSLLITIIEGFVSWLGFLTRYRKLGTTDQVVAWMPQRMKIYVSHSSGGLEVQRQGVSQQHWSLTAPLPPRFGDGSSSLPPRMAFPLWSGLPGVSFCIQDASYEDTSHIR